MAHYTVLGEGELAEVMARFGLPAPSQSRPEPRGAVNSGYHVWSGGRRYFLRVNEVKAEADVRFEAEVQRYLHAAQFPVPELLLAPDGRPSIDVRGRSATLFAYAAGEELAPEAIAPDRCHRLGEELGRLHELAAGFDRVRPNPYGVAWVAGRLRALAPRTGGGEVPAALPVFEEELARAPLLPGAPRGLVHGDLFPDNVLWIGDRVSAVLDWEMSCTDPFAYDLGVAINSWCWEGAFRSDRARALVAGYRSRHRLEPETAEGAYPWTRWAALRFAVARLAGYAPAGASAPPPPGKDWREYRDRLDALRRMGEAEYRALLGV